MTSPGRRSTPSPQRLRNGLLVAACAFGLGACVTQGKYDELAKERDGLAEQNKSLSAELGAERGKLSSTSEELKAASEQLQAIKAKTAEQEATFAKLKKELSGELAAKQLTLRQMKDGISVDLPEDILFPSGSATLRDSGREVLAKVSEQLRDTPYQIIVSGFTDNVPISGRLAQRFPTNWDLAAARATNVVRLLEEKQVPAGKLIAASYGENRPVADNGTEDGRKKNRRIEIHLRPVIED